MSQSAASPLPADRPLLGIGLMLCFCAIVPFADALAKILGTDFPLMQLILVRFATQAILLVPLALWLGARFFPSPRILRLTAIRGPADDRHRPDVRLAALPAAGRCGRHRLRHALHHAASGLVLPGRGGRAPPPRGLRGGVRGHADGGAAELRRGRMARAPAAGRGGRLRLLHAGHAQIARETDPVALQGRRRSLRFPCFCRWRFCLSHPTCRWWAGSRRAAGTCALRAARGDRGGGASLHDVVAALCALGDAGPDAVSRDPHRDIRRPDDLR
jgi:hypothetical protein